MSAITASEFKNRATRLINIPGFEPEESIQVRIKPTSMMSLLVKGKLPNELMGVVQGLFQGTQSDEEIEANLMNDPEMLGVLSTMMDKVCENSLVEPLYIEIVDYITDEQKQAIFEACVGSVQQFIPSIQK